MSDNDPGSPTVLRRELARLLRLYREPTGLTIEAAARQIGKSSRSLTRWEGGLATPPGTDLGRLCDLYEVQDSDRDALLSLAEDSRASGWWVPYYKVLRPTYRRFIGLEAGAKWLREYGGMLVPGLLQTEPYMRALMNTYGERLDDKTIDTLIEVRLRRQEEMSAAGYPRHYIIDEACLHRAIGGRAVMHAQMTRLIRATASRHVTIQVVPFATGACATVLGGFAVLGFGDSSPVACVELLAGDLYRDGAEAMHYTELFDAFRQGAQSEPVSVETIERFRERFTDGTR